MRSTYIFLAVFVAAVVGQQVGTLTPENHPNLNFQHCTKSGCQQQSGSVTLDSNWRWTHAVSGSQNCYTGNTWDTSLCPDPVSCATNCALDGADYQGTYGVTSDGTTLTLGYVKQPSSSLFSLYSYLVLSTPLLPWAGANAIAGLSPTVLIPPTLAPACTSWPARTNTKSSS